MKTVFLGTSGYNYRDWRGKFYPENLPQRKWLSYYSKHFDTVEINNSFYVAVKDTTYQKWYKDTPENFLFVIKGHRYITQLKKLHDVEDAVENFFMDCRNLHEKLSCILWQFPSSFRCNGKTFKRLQNFLKLIPQNVRHAFEFRDISWFTSEVNNFLEKNNSCLVISQSLKFPQIEFPNKNFIYIRFHGPTSLYSSGYTHKELKKWAEKIHMYLKKTDVYVYFNNDAGGYALDNVETLRKFINLA